ncbi:hypothetical protein PILCRDRAFT_10660 [Piloderma croceum F 1598]|uniref:DNA replication factor RFC1 C-terminal domain-containing protein n=1 Tax=Piloderma croceum (strain F 1598) TaxID=765440 RepID=A0A0C3F2G3_PILCF|nr:hypothetical protein PILCRDRAFT_10660 [Piloderma croceum F 1598]
MNVAGVAITDKTCLIMDEVDGMSAGDRGGVGALNALIKKTKFPIICIVNDPNAQKLKPLIASTFALTFKKPDAAASMLFNVHHRYREKMKILVNVMDQLYIPSVKSNEKFSIMTPFDVIDKMLGPYMFSHPSRETLGDKMELYFHDHSFIPLFIQENYLKTHPVKIKNLDGPPQILRQLELMDKAASSISDGDLVDALIHGPEQHWGLMPLHAVCSTIRPASFLYGQGAGYGGPNAMSFPHQNSKQVKLSRQIGDVQIRMRLKVSGNKSVIRQSYLPALFPHIVRPLMDVGASAVEDVIERMDEYYLSREDWDTVVELGVDQNKDVLVLKKISAATKTTLMKKYNMSDHPIPFHKAQDLGKAPKKLGGGPAPDVEDAYDFVDDAPEPVSDDDSKNKSPDDISIDNDKLIKTKKAKGKGKK